jgi:hypothetical protein
MAQHSDGERTFSTPLDGHGQSYNALTEATKHAMDSLNRQHESYLLSQLGELVKQGLLEVVVTQPVLVGP